MDQSVATRGFYPSEYHSRLERAQARMAMSGISALLLTTEPEVRYFTGFLTRFWESPTRPWFLVVPAQGDPVAVIPSIGAHLMARSWITDIRCWSSPDYEDDGISLLAEALAEAVPAGEWVGVPSGGETHLRMPLTDWEALKHRLPDRLFGPDAGIMRKLRMVKSHSEIACIRAACDIGARAFDRLPEVLHPGVPLAQVFRRFQMLALDEGADWVPYLAGAAGPDGYGDVISPADETPLREGDVLMLDTGLMHNGYFCDFDRNISLGAAGAEVIDAHARLLDAVQAGFAAARPGARAADLFHAMAAITGGSDVGRLGHGLGMQLTEPPSLIAADTTRLEPGMVLTLEPGIALSPSRMLVHEEDIVITETGAEWLTPPATGLPEVPV